jgi:hypothetical protein
MNKNNEFTLNPDQPINQNNQNKNKFNTFSHGHND